MSGHTPGPWRAGRHDMRSWRSSDGMPHHYVYRPGDEAETRIEVPGGNCFEDACFIAAAPETAAERDRLKEVNVELRAEIKRAQQIIDGLKSYRERIITLPHKSTPAMRARTRELATGRDDFDRAVILILDDLDCFIAAAKDKNHD